MKKIAAIEHDDQMKSYVDFLVKLLIRIDDNPRREVVRRIMQETYGPAVDLLVNRLIDLLGERGKSLRHHMAAALAEMGFVVAPILQCRIIASRSASLQIRLVDILARIGKSVSPARHGPIQVDLEIAFAFARSNDVVAALVKAETDLCPTNETACAR